MKWPIFVFLILIFFYNNAKTQAIYFPLKGMALIGPNNVLPQSPGQARYYIDKYETLLDSLEQISKKYKEELKLGVPRAEVLLTYRDMKRSTKRYIRLWRRIEKREKKKQRVARKAYKLQNTDVPFEVETRSGIYSSDSIMIEYEETVTWEEVMDKLNIEEYEEYVVEDNMQWEKVTGAKGNFAKLNGGFQFKKKPYVDYRLVNEYEGCLNQFEEIAGKCLNSVILTRKVLVVRALNGQQINLLSISK